MSSFSVSIVPASDILFYLLVVTPSSPPHHFLWSRWNSNIIPKAAAARATCTSSKKCEWKDLFSACVLNKKTRNQLSSKCCTPSFIKASFSGIRGWRWGHAGYILASETNTSGVMFLYIMSFGSRLQSLSEGRECMCTKTALRSLEKGNKNNKCVWELCTLC